MGQKARFWSWRAFIRARSAFELALIAFVLFIGMNAIADALHKPLIADRVQHQHIVPAAHTK